MCWRPSALVANFKLGSQPPGFKFEKATRQQQHYGSFALVSGLGTIAGPLPAADTNNKLPTKIYQSVNQMLATVPTLVTYYY